MKVFIDWATVREPEDFYGQLFSQLESPEWHGKNLNALTDSLVTGDINGIEPPFCIINQNTGLLREDLQDFFSGVKEIYAKANSAGRKIRVFSE